MKTVILGLTALIFTSCAGIERINASHKSDNQLKLRLTQLERELGMWRWGSTALHDVSMLESERDAIERELLDRCERGDREACGTTFAAGPEDNWRWNAMSYVQRRQYQP